MECLAISGDQIIEVSVLRQFGDTGRNENAGFYLVMVTVPQALLVVRQTTEAVLADDILNTDQPRVCLVRV